MIHQRRDSKPPFLNLLSRKPGLPMTLAPVVPILILAMAGCSKGPTKPEPPPAAALPPLSAAVQRAAFERGRSIATNTFAVLGSNLQGAVTSGGISNALPFCSVSATPLTTGLADKHGVALRRVTHKPRNPADRADAAEMLILDSFELALHDSTNPPPPLVTNLLPGKATFFAPIVLNKELCLKCHGEPDKDIASADLAIIRKLYPQDEATGFKMGQLRGALRIDLPIAGLPVVP